MFTIMTTAWLSLTLALPAASQEDTSSSATIDGTGPGWVTLGADDFVNVNCDDETWAWEGSTAHCNGQPIGVIRSRATYTNFELVAEWRHLKPAGNSGIFLWAPERPLFDLEPGQLPHGIECQVLDLAYATQYTERTGKEPDWFTCHGDVFPVGDSTMTPFAPVSPNGSRSFPSEDRTRATPAWNHYYIRAINGEVRLWVNGVEVSGGTDCQPATGYLCLESEGSPVDFRNIRIRLLP